MKRLATALPVAIALLLPLTTASAQRFEGIITIRFNGAAGAGAGARGSAGRGNAGSGNAGRGSAGRGSPARGQADGNTAAEAMRSALSGGVQQIEYMTRRGKVRLALGGNSASAPAAMIYSPEEGVVYTLLPALSMYAETSLSDIAAAGRGVVADSVARPVAKPPNVTHTKQFEVIAGNRCEHVLFTNGTQKTDVCMAKGLGVFVMPPVGGAAGGWDTTLAAENGFPLKVTQPGGTVLMEVVKVERKALGEALFNVPDSYSRMPDPLRRPPGER